MMTFPFFCVFLLFQMDLWSCPSSSSSPPTGSWSSAGTVCLCSAPPPTWISQWCCSGFTMATLWPRWRTEVSTWRRPYFMIASCWPGTHRAERKKYELRVLDLLHSPITTEIHRLEHNFIHFWFFISLLIDHTKHKVTVISLIVCRALQ